MNDEWYIDELPAEFAGVNFAEKTMEVMLPNKTGFSPGNFYMD